MPGIGKTTIAKFVFNQLCYGFDESCFLSNINETPKQFNGLVPLQKQLLHDIFTQDAANINCHDRGKVMIKERLRHKRVLVVADDVAPQDQLKALMGERSWFGPGSRVIITTRDSNLLHKAIWHAFKDTKLEEDYIELSKDAVDYCGGLPLALEVIGACLYGKNKDRWKNEIYNLSRIPENNIQGKLLISFDALDEKEYVYNPEVVLETLRESGFQVESLLGLAPRGSPRYLTGKVSLRQKTEFARLEV
ncbi:disease resistance protein Roq1 [Populus trichocarpa]|uniref:disease resistance protein Roq1 n=1 Tax=Populus trichocarpa TaxID=3694 RepID=UPI002278988F|nr:disease resistance protein Roq1 [Populus trichocarpa]